MKRFVVLLSLMFIGFAFADTINLHWLNEDGSTYQNSTCTVDSDLNIPTTPPTKYGYTFTGWKMLNYIPIEYIESTGTQWIDTLFSPNQDTRTVFEFTMVNTTNPSIMGARTSIGVAAFIMNINKNNISSYYANESPLIQIGETTNRKLTIDKNKNLTTIFDDAGLIINSYTHAYQSFQTIPTIAMFAVKAPNNPSVSSYSRIYYFQIYDNNTLIRDFIPVLDYTGTPCMYDKVTEQFFYNQGTGQFIAGPVLQ